MSGCREQEMGHSMRALGLEMLSQGFEDFWVEVSSRQLCVGKSDGGVGGSLAGNGDLELF